MAMTVSGRMMAHQVAGRATRYALEHFGARSGKLQMPIKRHSAPSYLSKAGEAGFVEKRESMCRLSVAAQVCDYKILNPPVPVSARNRGPAE